MRAHARSAWSRQKRASDPSELERGWWELPDLAARHQTQALETMKSS